jgi:hypothetical protein
MYELNTTTSGQAGTTSSQWHGPGCVAVTSFLIFWRCVYIHFTQPRDCIAIQQALHPSKAATLAVARKHMVRAHFMDTQVSTEQGSKAARKHMVRAHSMDTQVSTEQGSKAARKHMVRARSMETQVSKEQGSKAARKHMVRARSMDT